jgi:nucleoside-triphosphatase THEP1
MKTIIKIFVTLLLMISATNARELLMIDTSGSVSGNAKEVKEIVRKYLKTSGEVLAFASSPYFVKNENELTFGGGTALSLALKKVQSLGVNYLTIVTDGEANNENESIRIANELKRQGVKICGVYVSNGSAIPKSFKLIADRTYGVSQINKALDVCNDSVKQELIGREAVHKSIQADKYVF